VLLEALAVNRLPRRLLKTKVIRIHVERHRITKDGDHVRGQTDLALARTRLRLVVLVAGSRPSHVHGRVS